MTSADRERRRPLLERHRRARFLLPLLLVLLIGASLYRYFEPPQGELIELNGTALGTTWFVKLNEPGLGRESREQARLAIRRELDRVDQLMSTWNAESELSRFNQRASTQPFPLSPPTLEVLEVAQHVSAQSGGALDITVGPLVRAWGFGAGATVAPNEPDAQTLARLKESVGYRGIVLDPPAQTVRKLHPETEIDLSAVAKGYAVDQMARALEALGFDDFLVEVGGELRAYGQRPGGGPFRVAIERPESDARGRSIFAIALLEDAAMATSGDYRTFYIRDGTRLSHLLDPRSARPIAHAVASVSVIDKTAASADAWATALGVLGPDEGMAVAEREHLAAYFILREPNDSLRGVATPRFAPLLADRQPADTAPERVPSRDPPAGAAPPEPL